MRARYVLGALGVVCLAACGSKNDANEKNFTPVVVKHLEFAGDLCLSLAAIELGGWNPEMIEKLKAINFIMDYDGNKNIDKSIPIINNRKHIFTNEASPYLKEYGRKHPGSNRYRGLCWGKMSLEKITKWEGPDKSGDFQTATVYYTYKSKITEDWAKKPEFIEMIQKIVDDAGIKEDKIRIKLSSIGWELDDYYY